MSKITQLQKLANYDAVVRQNDLLQYYLWDSLDPMAYRFVTHQGDWTLIAFRLTGAAGGYVVTIVRGGVPAIHSLDAITQIYATDHHPNTLDLRICLERARVERNKQLLA